MKASLGKLAPFALALSLVAAGSERARPLDAAEATTGLVVGTVTNSSAAPIAHAEVSAVAPSGRYATRTDAQGRFSDPQDQRALPNSAFKGFGRCGTDANGGYAFDTIKPGSVPDPDGKPQAPHILVAIFGPLIVGNPDTLHPTLLNQTLLTPNGSFGAMSMTTPRRLAICR